MKLLRNSKGLLGDEDEVMLLDFLVGLLNKCPALN